MGIEIFASVLVETAAAAHDGGFVEGLGMVWKVVITVGDELPAGRERCWGG